MGTPRTIFEIDGCKGYHDIDGHDYLVIESDKLEQYMSCLAKRKIKRIVLAEELGYKCSTIDFIEQLPFLEGVKIAESCNVKDFGVLYKLNNIVYLSLPKNKYLLDFSYFPNLSKLITVWNSKYKNLDKCKKLTFLWVVSLNSKTKDLRNIPLFSNLKHLTLVWANITSLQGLAPHSMLEKIDLEYCTKLESLEGIEIVKDSLTHLQIKNSKKIINHEHVSILKNLERLGLNSCGEVANIRFINELPKLNSFSFVDTNVLDGDLSPLLRLEHSGFFNKRHYSHKYEELNN